MSSSSNADPHLIHATSITSVLDLGVSIDDRRKLDALAEEGLPEERKRKFVEEEIAEDGLDPFETEPTPCLNVSPASPFEVPPMHVAFVAAGEF